MQTNLPESLLATPGGQEADDILRSCVYCGFCTATCPTYRLLGDELDGPRGRIYLIKQALEGQPVTAKTRLHLDRCLTCRSCETHCPSGVQYGRLLDIGRHHVEQQTTRPPLDRAMRRALRWGLTKPRLFGWAVRLARHVAPLLPPKLRDQVPRARSGASAAWPAPRHGRRMLVLQGCVQPALAPEINAAAARVLDRLGISLVAASGAGCCGALSHHLAAQEEGLGFMRRNIDAWWPHIDQGAEAIVMTASGCGAMVREYGHLLRGDPAYAAKAARVTELTRDLSEVLAGEDLTPLQGLPSRSIAFQSPCTLQHGQKLGGVVEDLLARLGFHLTPVAESHLCCGSAGTYSILQPALAEPLRTRKLEALLSGDPEWIATANIGCLTHLRAATKVPVRHWIELLDVDA